MKLSELFENFNQSLFEAITISFDDLQTIRHFLEVNENSINNSDNFYRRSSILKHLINPINNIFLHYVQDNDYKININIEESENKYGGNTYADWKYDLGTNRWNNTLTLIIPSNHFNINQIISIISHELTHLIQSYKSSKKKILNPHDLSNKKLYHSQKHEIDAYAQSIATNIILKSTEKNIHGENALNINSINNNIAILQGLSKLPLHLSVFDYIKQHYETYKKYFKSSIEFKDIETWKRLNKKIMQKLQYYKDIHEFKYGGIPYNVYDKDGDDWGIVYKPKDKPLQQFKSEMIKLYGDDGLILQKQISKPSLP